jgi:methionyl-tRNA formyltransferase
MRTVLFCGHGSRYGLSHLGPVLRNFDVIAVVAATQGRWANFRQQLSGEAIVYPPSLFAPVDMIADIARTLRRRLAEWLYTDLRFALICRRAGVPVWWTSDVNEPGFVRKISECTPDVILSAAYPQFFSNGLLGAARRGGINFHPAALPQYRGSHPHFWTIAKGEKEGGVTAHFMTQILDGGPVVAQIRFPILNMYYSEYYRAIVERTPALVGEVREFLVSGQHPTPQTGESSFFRNDREVHHCVSWGLMNANEIHNLVRTERAFCTFRGRLVWVRRADVCSDNRNMTNQATVEPGTIVDIEDTRVVVAARDDYVGIASLSDGRRKMKFARWTARHRPRIGERFS